MKHYLSFIINILLLFVLIQQAIAQNTLKTDSTITYQLALDAIKNNDYIKAEDYLNELLIQNPYFQQESGKSAWYWLGVVLGKIDQSIDAIKIYEQGMDSLKSPDLYLQYHLARLYAENQMFSKSKKITRLVYDVINSVSKEKQTDLWELLWDQFKPLLPPAELNEILKNMDDPGIKLNKYILKALGRNDSKPASLQNDFLIDFFQRVKIAREKYPDISPRGYDVRGDYFVQLGEPEKIIWDHTGKPGMGGYAIYPYEFWLYTNVHPELYLTFIGKTGKNSFELVDGPESLLGDFYKARSFSRYRTKGYAALVLRIDFYSLFAPLHRTFKGRMDQLMQSYSAEEALEYAAHHFPIEDRAHRAQVDTILQSIVLGSDFSKEGLSVDLSGCQFLDKSGKIRTEFYYSIPLDEFEFQDLDSLFATVVQAQIGIFNEYYEFIAGDSLEQLLELPTLDDAKNKTFISQWTFLLDSGDHNLIFRIDNPQGKKQEFIRTDFEIEPYPADSLCMSDIQIASDIKIEQEDTRFHKNGYLVNPIPGNELNSEAPFFIYFEIYNLTKDNNDSTNYIIDLSLSKMKSKKGLFSRIFGGGKKEIKVFHDQVQQTGFDSFQIAYQKINVDENIEGEHTLKVHITDLNSNQTTDEDFTLIFNE